MISGVLLALSLGAPAQGGGEARLSLDVKDVEVKTVVALLAEAGGLQSVVDPDVSCRLTLKTDGLSWRATFEHVLRACRLASEEDGPVVRVAPLERLAHEARERRDLAAARGESRPRRLELVPLNYARAEELAPVLKKLLPPGSEVHYDRRTNVLLVVSQ